MLWFRGAGLMGFRNSVPESHQLRTSRTSNRNLELQNGLLVSWARPIAGPWLVVFRFEQEAPQDNVSDIRVFFPPPRCGLL